MAWRSVSMLAARVAVAPLAALLALAVAAEPSTMEPVRFEAAFQGRCGEGSPCEQLCRELHDGTFECGCGPGFELHVNGYSCSELNSTKSTELPELVDVLYQKDVSVSAELAVAPSSRLRSNIVKHITTERLATLPVELKEDYTYTGEKTKRVDGIKDLIDDGISKMDLNIITDVELDVESRKVTTLGPSLEQKVPGGTSSPAWTASVETCRCESCGNRCLCPAHCKTDAARVSTPRFSGVSWLALRALRGAYKRVRVRIRVRPERTRGVLLLTGEHDDLSGDYLALILRNGHVELRFDCGSGAGILRSPEPVRLGHWNTISVYRHRWDAWLRLNNGKRVRGRSKGLFSRMTFREPVWVGGAGNTTGLQGKLGLADGLLGCVDFLRINGDTYQLVKDAVATLDIGECAPTLAPWKPIHEATAREALSKDDKHIYDINDIVNFEDNDIVMRDARIKFHDNNKLDNSVDPLNEIQKLNMAEYKNTVAYVEEFKPDDPVKEIQKLNMVDDFKNKLSLNHVRNENKDTEQIKNYVPINDVLKSGEANMGFKNGETNVGSKNGEINGDLKNDKEFDSCECEHGGGCVNHGCLCPLGYAGDKCEITLDLKVPRFNGSSYLRLPGLGSSAASWLDIQITLKPTNGDGLILYNSEHTTGDGDFFSLHLRDYFVEFAFDLGSGIALVRSAYPLEVNQWHKVSVSRAGRRASLRVKTQKEQGEHEKAATRWVSSRGTARWLTLNQPLLLGGAPQPLPQRLALSASFSGCVGQLIINDEELSVVSSALGGLNVDNCDELTDNNCTDKNHVNELIKMPAYPQNITENEIHRSIVPKKGTKIKYHKSKAKKHAHIDKRKKYFVSKKRIAEMTNDVYTEKPYDGQTYMQIKYLSASELNWGEANTYPSFTGVDSFIHIDDEESMKRLRRYTLDINIRFRAVAPDALLVWSGRPPRDFLSLAVENSVLVLRYDLGSGEVVIIANHTKVDDGLWHRARATRNRQAGVLEVDGLGSVGKVSPGKHKQLNTENGLYIGGLPSIEMNTLGKYKTGLIGCVSQISLSGDYDIPLSLSKLPHTITNNVGRCAP